jgi:predicted ATPase
MLTSVRLQGFKSFTDATVKLAPLTVLIGANGSGKSNFLDAMRILHRLRDDNLEKDPFDSLVDDRSFYFEPKPFSLDVDFSDGERFSGSFDEFAIEFRGNKSDHRTVSRQLKNSSFLNLMPARLRQYERQTSSPLMEEDGTGFAGVVAKLCQNESTKTAYLDWLKELRPEQIIDVEVRPGAANDLMFGLVEKHFGWMAAPALSDGTLRFSALASALFQPVKPNLVCIEEIENGMHPARLRLVLELLRAFVANGTQVIVTTHAPWLLAWLSQEELAGTQIFYRSEDGASQVKSCGEHPFLMDALKNTPIEELFAEGYLEQTL